MQQDFDHIATQYDTDFTHTLIGKAQRQFVWKHLGKLKHNCQVLELNCGTGEDALQLTEKGCLVEATDISPEMVQVASEKLKNSESRTFVQDITQLSFQQLEGKDLVFSNFGGLNCLSPKDWQNLAHTFQIGLENNARLVMVIMGKKCLWEKLYFLFRPKKKWSRNSKSAVEANVEGKLVKTWYYSPSDIVGFMGLGFNMTKRKPIGFFIPPSYLEGFVKKRRGLFKVLLGLEKAVSSWSFLSNYADHFYIEFQKKNG